jgi:hypothetical protein
MSCSTLVEQTVDVSQSVEKLTHIVKINGYSQLKGLSIFQQVLPSFTLDLLLLRAGYMV